MEGRRAWGPARGRCGSFVGGLPLLWRKQHAQGGRQYTVAHDRAGSGACRRLGDERNKRGMILGGGGVRARCKRRRGFGVCWGRATRGGRKFCGDCARSRRPPALA